MYRCETWAVGVDDSRQLNVIETKLPRHIAGITCVDWVSNADLLKRLQYNTTILDRIRVQKLSWLGQVQLATSSACPMTNYLKLPSNITSTVHALAVTLRRTGRKTSRTITSLVFSEWHKTESSIGNTNSRSWGERPRDDHQGRIGLKSKYVKDKGFDHAESNDTLFALIWHHFEGVQAFIRNS